MPDNENAAPANVTVNELATEYNIEAREIRVIIRSLGLKAPATETEGFGPRSKYEWAPNDPDLKKIATAIEEKIAAKGQPKAPKAPKAEAPKAAAKTDKASAKKGKNKGGKK